MPRCIVERVGVQHDGEDSPAMRRADHEHGPRDPRPRIADHDAIAHADLTHLLEADPMIRKLLNSTVLSETNRTAISTASPY